MGASGLTTFRAAASSWLTCRRATVREPGARRIDSRAGPFVAQLENQCVGAGDRCGTVFLQPVEAFREALLKFGVAARHDLDGCEVTKIQRCDAHEAITLAVVHRPKSAQRVQAQAVDVVGFLRVGDLPGCAFDEERFAVEIDLSAAHFEKCRRRGDFSRLCGASRSVKNPNHDLADPGFKRKPDWPVVLLLAKLPVSFADRGCAGNTAGGVEDLQIQPAIAVADARRAESGPAGLRDR